MKQVTFEKINTSSKIFEVLNNNNFAWWERFKSEPSFYIEVRKNNQINVYYEGGNVVRLHYCTKRKVLQAFTHCKYLGHEELKNKYIDCIDILDTEIDNIVSRIKKIYSEKYGTNKEKWSEKYIQGHIIEKGRTKYIDSEFAYKNKETDIRIDLVECVNGQIRFVELKRLDDNRMLKKTDNDPEVITQMKNYKQFAIKNRKDILEYYNKIYDIKKSLKLPIPPQKPISICVEPLLIIFNRWEKKHSKRDNHRQRMEKILQREKKNFDYIIIDEI